MGRQAAVEGLYAAWRASLRGEVSIVVVEGDAGHGKTSILNTVERSVRVESAGPCLRAGAAEEDVTSSGRLLSILTAGLTGGRQPSRSVEEATGEVADAAVYEPVVVLLDDLHWADDASLAAIGGWPRRLAGLPVFVVVTLRPLPARTGVARLQERLHRAGVAPVQMAPLGERDVRAIAAERLGAVPGPRLMRALAHAGGNPMFVEELVGALEADGLLRRTATGADLDRDVLPVTLRAVLVRRVAALGAPACELLRAASVLGTTFAPDLAATMCGVGPSRAVSLFEAARNHGLVDDAGEGLKFRHDLIRRAIYEDIPASVRAMMHGRAADVLERAGARPSQVARHAVAASGADGRDPARLIELAHRLTPIDPGAATKLLKSMAGAPAPLAHRVAALTAHAKVVGGEPLSDDDLSIDVSALLPGDRSAFLMAAATQHGRADRPQEADACYTAALKAAREAGSTRSVAVLAALHARLAAQQRKPDAGERLRAALRDAERARSRTAQLAALGGIAMHALLEHFDVDAAERALRGIDVERLVTTTPSFLIGYVQALRGNLDGAAQTLETVARISDELRLGYKTPALLSLAARFRRWQGDWEVAAVQAEAAQAILDDLPSPPDRTGMPEAILARLAFETTTDLVVPSTSTARSEALALFDLAGVAADRGDAGPAAAIIDGATGCEEELVGFIYDGPLLVRSLVKLGDRTTAARILDRTAHIGSGIGGQTGRLAIEWARSSFEGDPVALAATARDLDAAARPFDAALAREDAGRAALARGDRPTAMELLRASHARYEQLGATRRAEDLRGLLPASRRSRRRPKATTGWESLTATERRVAHLVARPATNGEIAGELFVSRRTVETHVAHILQKLNMRNRVELVAYLNRASDNIYEPGERTSTG